MNISIHPNQKQFVIFNMTEIIDSRNLSVSDFFLLFAVISMNIQKLQEVAIGNFIPHPATVITITLTSIRTETGTYFHDILSRQSFYQGQKDFVRHPSIFNVSQYNSMELLNKSILELKQGKL